VAVFKLKQTCNPADVIADGVIHILGVSFGLIGSIALFLNSPTSAGIDVAVYAASPITMLGLSATYNLWPVSPRKWLLRRFDHSAIYLLIAATYTPFISQIDDRSFAINFLIGVWGVAIAGTLLKLNFPGRFDKLSILLYLAMGWRNGVDPAIFVQNQFVDVAKFFIGLVIDVETHELGRTPITLEHLGI
jgi:hemolysin III